MQRFVIKFWIGFVKGVLSEGNKRGLASVLRLLDRGNPIFLSLNENSLAVDEGKPPALSGHSVD